MLVHVVRTDHSHRQKNRFFILVAVDLTGYISPHWFHLINSSSLISPLFLSFIFFIFLSFWLLLFHLINSSSLISPLLSTSSKLNNISALLSAFNCNQYSLDSPPKYKTPFHSHPCNKGCPAPPPFLSQLLNLMLRYCYCQWLNLKFVMLHIFFPTIKTLDGYHIW